MKRRAKGCSTEDRSLHALLLLGLFASSCATVRPLEVRHEAQSSGTTASLRGVFAVDDQVAFASGSGGTVLRTVDGGAHWESQVVPGYEAVEIRDVHASDAEHAWFLGCTEPAVVLATADGGRTFHEVLRDPGMDTFFDGMAISASGFGLLFGDPRDGRLVVHTTCDGGASWTAMPAALAPAVRPGEAGFAASGTCVAVREDQVWIGLGGGSARVLRSTDAGRHFEAADTPLRADAPSAGVFSIAFHDARHGVVVGGDYSKEAEGTGSAAWSDDGGRTWHAAARMPAGFRSAVLFVPRAHGAEWIATGPSGTDHSADGGRTYAPLEVPGYHALALAPSGNVAWAVGSGGRIGRLTIRR